MTSSLRDTIAVLDGLNPSASGGANYSGGSTWFPGAPVYPSSEGLAGGYMVASVRRNPSGSGGANYSGGSTWYPGAPVYPSSEGLAAMRPLGYSVPPALSGGGRCVAWNRATGDCAAFAGINESDPYAEYMANDPYSANEPGDSYDSYLAAFRSSAYVAERQPVLNPSASGGANYSGGSNWFPGSPVSISSDGLAGVRRRAALMGALAAGALPGQAVEIAAVAQHSFNAPNARGQAYQVAYAAARARGWDTGTADAIGRRIAESANGWLWTHHRTHT